MEAMPKRWVDVKKTLQNADWKLDRISGSHHIFTKPGVRCIPVAIHGGTISPQYAARVIRQAGLSRQEAPAEIALRPHEPQNILAHVAGNDSTGMAGMENKVKGSTKQVREELPRPICKQPSKAMREKEARQRKESEILLRNFEELQLQRLEDKREKEAQRADLLARIQDLVARGDYGMAIDSTTFIKGIGDFGSSDDDWLFNCDVLFYRTVALSEYALSSCAFDSEEQRGLIEESFDLLSIFIESSPERREETREFVPNIQCRIIKMYSVGLSKVYVRYSIVSMSIGSFPEETRMLIRRIKMLHPDIEQEACPSQELFNKLMNQLVHGFEFVVSVTKGRQVPLLRAFDHGSSLNNCVLLPIIFVCVRKMLVSFDLGDYSTVSRLLGSIESFARENREMIDLMDIALAPVNPPCARANADLLIGISSHVKALIPAYLYLNETLQWKRFAGAVAFEEILKPHSRVLDFDGILKFMELVISAFIKTETYLMALVVSNQSCRFIFDTFNDPVFLTRIALEVVLFADKNVSRKIVPVFKDFCNQVARKCAVEMDGLLLQPSKEFRRSGYDKLRVQSTRLCTSILQIKRIFDKLVELEASVARPKMVQQNYAFLQSRFEVLPEALGRLVMLMKIMFGPDNVSVSLLTQTVTMIVDLDMAENFDTDLDEGKIVGQVAAAGGKKTPEAVRAAGIWSMSLTFNIMMRPFLRRFVHGNKLRRLLLIDRLTDEPVLGTGSLSATNRFEPLAFDLVSALTALDGNSLVCDIDVEKSLELVLSKPENHSWCESFDTDGAKKRRWIKDRARRFSKLIDRLRQGLSSLDSASCLAKLEISITYLIDKLQESVQLYRKLPDGLQQSIRDSPTDDNIVRACQSLKQWTREELYQILEHIIQLEELSEEFTGYCSRVTGGAFPEALAITSCRWTMSQYTVNRNQDFSFESSKAIHNLMYVRAILRVHTGTARASSWPSS